MAPSPTLASIVSGAPSTLPHPLLLLISDSILQSGLPLLSHLVSCSISAKENTIIVALEQTKSRLVPPHPPYDDSIEFIDCLPRLSDPPLSLSVIEEKILHSISTKKGKPLLLVLDSIDELMGIQGEAEGLRTLRSILLALEGTPGARLVTIHHSSPTPSKTTSIPLIQTLSSPSISQSTLHLTLHPCSLLETFSREYSLRILPPSSPSTDPPDERVFDYLNSFAGREYGTPFRRPKNSRDQDERIPLHSLSSDGGECVLEWSSRGIQIKEEGEKRIQLAVGQQEKRKLLQRGIAGLRSTEDGLEVVPLASVLRKERMGIHSLPSSALPTPSTHPSSSKTAREPPPLTFNLSLTDSQRQQRDGVILPYLPKPGEALPSGIYSGSSSGVGGVRGGGGIEYVPDEEDDMDDDEPDEDLEI